MVKIKSVIAAILSVCFLLPQSVMADTGSAEYTFDAGRTGSVTIDYRDADGETAVSGAGFTLYKVAEYTDGSVQHSSNGPVVETPIKSVIRNVKITSDTDPEEIRERVESTYEKGIPEGGAEYKIRTKKDGTGKLKNMELGVYLGVETKPASEYASSIPFLISLPESLNNSDENGADAWNYDVIVYPKVLPLGDLKITKTLKGDNTEKKRQWHFVVVIDKAFADSNPDGASRRTATSTSDNGFETNDIASSADPDYGMTYDRLSATYKYVTSTGKKGTMRSGDTLSLKGGESVTVKGIPIGAAYNVTEKEANQNGYITRAKNQNGTIREKTPQKVTFVNERNKPKIQTSDNRINLWYVFAAATAVALIIFVIASGRKKEKKS